MHLGIVAPLPPVPSGVAEWVRAALPLLEAHAEITCFVPDLEEVDASLRATHRIRSIAERGDPSVDMLIYHVGNNQFHEFVLDALKEGPAGLVEVHDGSLHHYVQDRTLGVANDPLSYIELGEGAHGWAGRRLADMRWRRYRGAVELFLYDYLQIALDRARGVIVHSRYAEQLVQLRCPRVHTWTVPLHAPQITTDLQARSWTGIDESKLLIAHLGFVTLPKRSDVYLAALRRVLDRGLDAHFVFAGKPDALVAETLPRQIERLGLGDHVTVTGYLENADLERWVQAIDVIVNLRAPHVGESSGSLAYGLSAGKAVVVQPIGSWAELPEEAVVRLPVTEDDAGVLADTLFALGQDASLRNRVGNKAREYALSELDAHRCAELLVRAATEAAEREWTPPAWVTPGRTVAALTFLRSGNTRVEALLGEVEGRPSTAVGTVSGAACREALERITPARPHGRLLAIDAPSTLLHLLAAVWGYNLDATTTSATTGDVVLAGHVGVPAYTVHVTEFAPDRLSADVFDVVIVRRLPDDADVFLALCNRVMTPQGTLVVLDTDVSDDVLDKAGFSPHVHNDHPGWVVPISERPLRIVVGTKASLPVDSITL